MSKNKQIIGILGGMGPQASAHLLDLLIDQSIKMGVKNDSDFPEIILDSVPVPNFISDTKNLDQALKILKSRVRLLNKMNISQLAIACNTAHILLDQLQKVSKAPFVSIVDEVVSSVTQSKVKVVGVIGTPSALRYEIYQKALKEKGVAFLIPTKSRINILEKIIRNVLKGKSSRVDQKQLILIADSLKRKGAMAIVLGCTELPLVFPKRYSLPVYNSVEILAKALLRRYYGDSKMK